MARLVAEGRTNPEIADALGVSLAGAKYHVSELLGRLGLERREEIADWYRREHGGRSVRELAAPPVGWLIGGGAVAVGALLVVAAFVLLRDEASSPYIAGPVASALETVETPQGRWEVLPAPPVLLEDHFAVALGDGEVLVGGTSDGGWTSVWAFDLDRGEYEQVAETTVWLGDAFAVGRPDGRVTVGLTEAASVIGPPDGRSVDPREGACRAGFADEPTSETDFGVRRLREELRTWDPGAAVLCPLELDTWVSPGGSPSDELALEERLSGRTAGLGLDARGDLLIATEGSYLASRPPQGWGQVWRLNEDGHELSLVGYAVLTAGDLGDASVGDSAFASMTTVVGPEVVAFATDTDLVTVDADSGGSQTLVASGGAGVELSVRSTGAWLDDGRLLLTGGYTRATWAALLESQREQGVTVFLGERADHWRLRRGEFAAADRVLIADPVSGEVTEVAAMPAARVAHTMTVLNDGRVLIAGGVPFGGWSRGRSEPPKAPPPVLYDPATDTYEELVDAPEVPPHLTATALGDGSVLFLGTAFADAGRTSGVSTAIRFTPAAP